ncbi:serpin family protein [Erythrobacter sp. 3-20A1M]|uniref:serpin family protein n=1 Tax=Erythrobacter sp. 3-20A1M TaxID=2653850 RepID=UPI001BFC0465|nr:serpin family protein [Erythrobacter sp. 3-20A1M]
MLDEKVGPEENAILSPASVEQAFGLAELGADGATREQIQAILSPPSDSHALEFESEDATVSIANSLWLSDRIRFSKEYVADAAARYAATAEQVDFRNKEAVVDRVNAWSKEATRELIPKIIRENDIGPGTTAILANALYFEGGWANKFGSASEQPFLFGNGQEKPFVLMHERAHLVHASKGGWKAVRIPYAERRYVMDVIIPKRRTVMAKAPDLGTIDKLTHALSQNEPRYTELSLPRFEAAFDTGLIEPLKTLGLRLPFSDEADFSRMSEPGEPALSINRVKHFTRLQVFEKGTRAAAVTVLSVIVVTGPRREPPKPEKFIVDRPFAFVVRDLETDTVLFVGRIANPAAYDAPASAVREKPAPDADEP